MKKSLLLFFGLIPFCLSAQIIFEENFDSYTAGDFAGIASPWMNTWSLTPGSAEDCLIVNTQSSTPSNSIEIIGNTGPIDAMVIFPQDYTAGTYQFSMNMYVVAGQAGYFNCQESTNPGDGWKIDVYFANDGTGYVVADGVDPAASFSYSADTWFPVVIWADLTNNQGTITIDGNLIHTFTWSTGVTGSETVSGWGGMDLFAYGPSAQAADYFVDDLKFEKLGTVSLGENEGLDFTLFPNPSNGQFEIQLNNTESYDVFISDVTGKIVYSKANINTNHIFDLDLESGTYFLILQNDDEKVVKNIVIE